MLFRIRRSGRLTELSQASLPEVTKGIDVQKAEIRPHIPQFPPF